MLRTVDQIFVQWTGLWAHGKIDKGFRCKLPYSFSSEAQIFSDFVKRLLLPAFDSETSAYDHCRTWAEGMIEHACYILLTRRVHNQFKRISSPVDVCILVKKITEE